MYSLTLRSLFARRRRVALTSLAVLLGVAMVAGTFVFTDTIHRAYTQLFRGQAAGAQIVVGSKQGLYSSNNPPASIPAALVARINRLPGVATAQGQISGVAGLVDKHGRIVKGTGSTTLAVSFLSQPFGGFQFVTGTVPSGPAEVALEQSVAARNGYRVGDEVSIVTGEPARRFRVSGLVSVGGATSAGPTVAVFDSKTAAALYNKIGRVDLVYVAAANGTTPAALKREIAPLLPQGVSAQTVPQAVDADLTQINDQLGVLIGGLLAFGLLAVFVSAFVIVGTLSITLASRTRELAVLRALGATRRQALGAVILESGLVGILSSVGGLALGLAVALGIRALLGLAGTEVPSTGLVLEPRTLAISFGLGLLVTIAAGLPPALRATRVSPIEAMRASSAPVARDRPSWATMALAAVLALAGAALVLVRPSSTSTQLQTSTAGAVLLVLAGVLLSPLVVRRVGIVLAWPLERGDRVLGRLARENAIRTPARTAITASSLMIGLALVLFVSVYIGGVRTSARRAIDHTFVADFAIGNQDGTSSIPAASVRAVATVPDLMAVSSLKDASAAIVGAGTVTASGFDPSTFGQVYRFDWVGSSVPTVPALGAGDVLVERDTARAAHLRVGERVQIKTAGGLGRQLTVRGIYADTGLLRGVAMPVAEFDQLFNQDRLQQVFIKLQPGSDLVGAEAQLRQSLSTLPGVVVRSEQQLRDQAARRVDHVLLLFYALLAMSAVMALLGILTALTLSIHERTRELGILRAVGMTRAQARKLIRDESLITAEVGTLIGIVLGIAIAWIVTRALSSEGIAFSVPWPELGLLVVVGLTVGVLASLPAAARAARVDVLSAIAHE
jgi:putative ABC transport system permease protein